MRTPIIAGNWKMHKTIEESVSMVKELIPLVSDVTDVEIVVCPTFTALSSVNETIKDTNIKLGAQNMWFEEKGAFTGEISPLMLKSAGCKYVILGHSERREIFKETNDVINKKLKKAFDENLIPILCVGEKLEEREAGITENVLKDQITNSLDGITKEQMQKIIIAYEPVWAIGTGKTATPETADEAHYYIRKLISELYDEEIAESLRIQYGGSVKPNNVKELMAKENIDGALVGGASLEAESFRDIIIVRR